MKITDLATHPRPYVTMGEFITYTEIPRRTMYHHVESGKLKAVKMGGTLKIPIEEARRFVSIPARPHGTNGSNGDTEPGPELFCATST